MRNKLARIGCAGLILLFTAGSFSAHAEGSRLLATSGVSQIEGAAGGGLVPWAIMSGYGDEGQWSAGAFHTLTDVQDYRLSVDGASLSFNNRFEISAARQSFEIKGLAGDIRQEVYGVKARAYGDLVYGAAPQIAVGLQHKRLIDGDIASLVGAEDNTSGTDVYLSASKVHLAALAGYHLLWNATLRATKANQMGLLGFGGDDNNDYQLMPEVSALILLDEGLAVGAEYRAKPDNLSAFSEDSFKDVFIAWFPNKQVSLTAAYADLGSIAGSEDQAGLYVSLAANFK